MTDDSNASPRSWPRAISSGVRACEPRLVRCEVELHGIVQGVGFRPHLARLAMAAGLGGAICNRSGAVHLVLEGEVSEIRKFLSELPERLPSPARITECRVCNWVPIERLSPHPFEIVPSQDGDAPRVVIPPDLAICPECIRDVLDPNNRRYRYPFTTCTRCGPRYTVLRRLPYDRERTTLRSFELCSECRREYADVDDRRYHAETIACPRCGPTLKFADARGAFVPGDALKLARSALARGEILAIRGIGGFQLVVLATHRAAVERLRARKRRPHKPLAVMAATLNCVRAVCHVDPVAANILESPEAPIVLLDVRSEGAARLPVEVLSPDTGTLGVMLPTSPLHVLLMHPTADDPVPAFEWLVVTSGNHSGEPIAVDNSEALHALSGIADAYLLHDREIVIRCDDSVGTVVGGRFQLWRRARGYVPRPVSLGHPLARSVLAWGPQQRNAVAFGRDREVILSPHVGDLDSPEALDALRGAVQRHLGFLDAMPDCVAVDLHPDYESTREGRRWAAEHERPVFEVQHHHAHAVACMAEYGLGEALALVLDGTGWGPDGRIWGAELLHVTTTGYDRLATFAPAPLPGGEAAIRDPRRQWVGRLCAHGLDTFGAWERWEITELEWASWRQQIAAGINCPWTHAAGRLFDAVSAALGLSGGLSTYDGRPALRLEQAARAARASVPLDFEAQLRDGLLIIDWGPAIRRIALEPRGDPSAVAHGFHRAVTRAAVRMAEHGRDRTGLSRIVLSGGCFMNRLLTEWAVDQLRTRGFEVFLHGEVPPNDGGLALGQAVVAGCSPADPQVGPARAVR